MRRDFFGRMLSTRIFVFLCLHCAAVFVGAIFFTHEVLSGLDSLSANAEVVSIGRPSTVRFTTPTGETCVSIVTSEIPEQVHVGDQILVLYQPQRPCPKVRAASDHTWWLAGVVPWVVVFSSFTVLMVVARKRRLLRIGSIKHPNQRRPDTLLGNEKASLRPPRLYWLTSISIPWFALSVTVMMAMMPMARSAGIGALALAAIPDYFLLWRISHSLSLTDTELSWKGPLRHGAVPLSDLRSVSTMDFGILLGGVILVRFASERNPTVITVWSSDCRAFVDATKAHAPHLVVDIPLLRQEM